VINVGAATETEMKEKKARVEDALHATRAAVEEGIVPGGGVALIRAQKALDSSSSSRVTRPSGVEIVRRAVEEPLRQLAANAGREGALVVAGGQEAQGQRRLQRGHRRVRRPGEGRRRRPDQGDPQRPAERRLHQRPPAHHRG